MNRSKLALLFWFILFLLVPDVFCQDKLPLQKHGITEWFPGDLVRTKTDGILIAGNITFSPIQTGKTSIGVRLNEQSWFKGAISQIKISPKALKTTDFLTF